MSCHSLPGITSIRIVRCSYLPADAMLQSLANCIVPISAPYETVEFCGRPVLSWESSAANGDYQEKSELEFSTIHPLPTGENLAFVVTSVDGAQYLIGTREPRYPLVNYSQTTGDISRSPSVRTYKITHLAQKSVLPCLL